MTQYCIGRDQKLEELNNMWENSFQTVICEICRIATVLDPGSATELLTMDENDFDNQNLQSVEDDA